MPFRMRRYRLYLTPAQAAQAADYAGCARLVWNVGLEHRVAAFRLSGRLVTYAEQCRELTAIRAEFPWLAAVPVHTLQQALLDLDGAFWRFRTGSARFPRFKPRGHRETFRFPDRKQFDIRRLSKKWATVRFPKLGWCRFRWTRSLDGEVRNATLKREGKHWFVCFCVDIEPVEPRSRGLPPVGVDVGVVTSVATSTGERL
ncbi:MAG TPA: transposase, partial [Acidimicrobiia bacterium]|nr:transposase [Acidimicrobiia bacterium]